MSKFQVQLAGKWTDYGRQEDNILKRGFLSGADNIRFRLRGQHYVYDFKNMVQKNTDSGKERTVRPPHKFRRPPGKIAGDGKVKFVKVPPGAAGTIVYVTHPEHKGEKFPVAVPVGAKPGAPMLVPVPEKKESGWSTGAKVAAGTAAAVGVGAAAVGGVMLGEHIADVGWDETLADLGDGLEDAGEGIADGAEAAVDWVGEAGEDVGEFFMDLF